MSEYPGYIKCIIDTETTGTDRKINEIWQISGCLRANDGRILEWFDYKFRPLSLEGLTDEALEKTNMTREKLMSFEMSAREAYEAFVAMLGRHCNKFDKKDKMQLVAYNAGFDSEFLREFFAKMGDNYFGSWFFNPAICVMQAMAMFLLDHRGALPNFKLETLCQSAGLGWDETKAHDALYDVHQTARLFDYVRENTRILGE
jgi:DNA polymerase III alpha subunit (gram-positive type)